MLVAARLAAHAGSEPIGARYRAPISPGVSWRRYEVGGTKIAAQCCTQAGVCVREDGDGCIGGEYPNVVAHTYSQVTWAA